MNSVVLNARIREHSFMNLAFSIGLLFTLLDCVTNESSPALKGCHVPLTMFYRPVKAFLKLSFTLICVLKLVNNLKMTSD